MVTLADKYLPQLGFNGVFSDIVNCDFLVRPTDTGFRHEVFCFQKRAGLVTQEDELGASQRELDGDVAGALYNNNIEYVYSDNGFMYTFDGSDLTELNTAAPHDYVSTYSPEPIKLSFIGGGRYPNASTAYTVSSYNNSTGVITFSGTPNFTSAFIGKYVYIASVAGPLLGQRQVRNVENTTTNTITLDAVLDIDLQAGDIVHIYNEIITQFWFPQLRKDAANDNLYARDTDGNDMFWYFPNSYKLVVFDNRIAQLNTNKRSIIFSDSRSYEIVDVAKTVPLGNSQALNIASYAGYLFIFFDDNIGILKKQVTDPLTGAYLYVYQDLVNFGLFSERSFFVQGNDLYIFANDRELYSMNLTVSSSGEVLADPVKQADNLTAFFKGISSGSVFFNYSLGTLRMVHVDDDENTTSVYKYNSSYQGWMRDVYNLDGNFMRFLQAIDTQQYTCSGSIIYEMSGLKDIDDNIEQKIQVYGPIQGFSDMFTLLYLKLILGFSNDGIGGSVECEIGGFKQYEKIGDIEDLAIIDEINSYVIGSGTIGSMMFGDSVVLGIPGFGNLEDYYSEYIHLGMKIGKKGSYFKVTITNETEKQLIFAGVVPIYNTDSSLMFPAKGVF